MQPENDVPLLPIFVESLLDVPVKDDLKLLEYPWFSLQKHGRQEAFEFRAATRTGEVKITVRPGAYGIATIFDKDFLIYCQSMLMDRVNRGLPVGRTFNVNIHDFMLVTGRSTGKRGYELVKNALDRLRTTAIETNIPSADETEERSFGWLDDYRIVTKVRGGRKVMTHVEVTINRWTYRAIVAQKRAITLNRRYFDIEGGLERRLYEIARKHCGNQDLWTISLDKLAEKCGTTQDLRSFKRDLKRVAEADRLPDYKVAVEEAPTKRERVAMEAGQPGSGRSRAKRTLVVVSRREVEVLPPDAGEEIGPLL